MKRSGKILKPVSLLMVLMLALSLASCGGTGKTGSNGAQDTSGKAGASQATSGTAGVADPKTAEPVTLKWITPIGSPNAPDLEKVWAEYNKQLAGYLPNTTVEFEPIAVSEYKTRWDLMMAAGEEGDIAWTGYLIPYADEVQKGSYMDVTELFDKYAKDIQAEVPAWFIDMGRVNGKLYSVPVYKDTVELLLGMYTPKESYDNYWDPSWDKVFYDNGLPYRASTKAMYDVFEQYLKKLKDAGKMGSGFSPWIWQLKDNGIRLTGGTDGAMIRLPNKGQKWDLQVKNYYELPETKLFFQTMADFYKKGYIRKDVLTLDDPRKFDNTASSEGSAIWFHMYSDPAHPGSEAREIMSSDPKIGPQEQVRLETDYYICRTDSSASLAIPRTAKNPERAMSLIDLMNTNKGKDIYRLLVYGIENVHYTKLGENKIKVTTGDPTNPAYSMTNFYIGNIINSFVGENDPDNAISYIFDEQNGKAIISPLTGLKFDTSGIKNEVTQCRAVSTEYYKPLILGGLGDQWESKYEEFLGKLKTAGIDKIIAELQKQIDGYIATQGLDKNNIIAD